MTSAVQIEELLDSLRQNRARIVQLAGGDENNLGDLEVTVASVDSQIDLAERLLVTQRELEANDPGVHSGGIEVPFDGPIRPV